MTVIDKPALTVKQAALLAGYCPATIRAYIHVGYIRAIKVRRSYRISRDSFEAFMAGDKSQGPPG